jgi:hypothetical protein
MGVIWDCDKKKGQQKIVGGGGDIVAPPPSGVAPPPSTQTCPENTALDANGNCAPVTQGPKETPSTDQGTTQPPTTDDNKPSKPKLPKGDILKLQP